MLSAALEFTMALQTILYGGGTQLFLVGKFGVERQNGGGGAKDLIFCEHKVWKTRLRNWIFKHF